MKTTLSADGQIGIPPEIRQADRLAPGDAFDFERLTPGQYLLAKRPPADTRFTVLEGEDGLPLIRVSTGVMTSQLVKEIESQMP
jgi:bifunctional DNA-binding transcriptional regulator/antitoxin component of YhaV-PrlF toxin-antitoxin module